VATIKKIVKKAPKVKKAQTGKNYSWQESMAEKIPSDRVGLYDFAQRKQNVADSLNSEYNRKFNTSEKLRKRILPSKATKAKIDSLRSSAFEDLGNYIFENTRAEKARKDASMMQNKRGGKVSKAKDGKWIQKATASIKKRGTEGVCTGKKFGGPTCKPGSKRYNLAKVFKGMAKKKK